MCLLRAGLGCDIEVRLSILVDLRSVHWHGRRERGHLGMEHESVICVLFEIARVVVYRVIWLRLRDGIRQSLLGVTRQLPGALASSVFLLLLGLGAWVEETAGSLFHITILLRAG